MEHSDQQISYNISFGMIYILLATVSNQPTESLFIELSQRFQKRLNLSDEDAENALIVIQDLFYTLDDPEIFEGSLNRAIEEIAQQSSAKGGLDFLKQVHNDLIKLSLADAEISFEEQLLLDRIAQSWQILELEQDTQQHASDDEDESFLDSFGMIYILLATVSNPPTQDLYSELSQRFQNRLNLSDEEVEAIFVIHQELFYTVDDPDIFEGSLNRAIEEIAQQSSAKGGLDFLKQVYHDLIELCLADGEISVEEQMLLDRIAQRWAIDSSSDGETEFLDMSTADRSLQERHQSAIVGLCLIGSLLSNPITDDLLDECVSRVSKLLKLNEADQRRITSEMQHFFSEISEAEEADRLMAEFLSDMDSMFEDSSESSSDEETKEEDNAFRDMFISSFVDNFQRFSNTIVEYASAQNAEDVTKTERLKQIHDQLYDLALQDGVLSQKEKDFLDNLARQWGL